MKIISEAFNGGRIPDRFGKRGLDSNGAGIPKRSPAFRIEDAPEGTVTYAVVLDDVDSFPVCGFAWIHWTVANLKTPSLEEDASRKGGDFLQGTNSWLKSSGSEEAYGYGGMTPPDAPHTYTLHVYALDTVLNLSDGFLYNELVHAMKGHVLAEETVEGFYRN